MITLKRMTSLTLSMLLCISLTLAPQISADKPTKPKTSAPPIMFETQAFYSGYTYLYAASVTIEDNNNETVTITPTTQAKQIVTELGATVQLQEWSGSAWFNVGSSKYLSSFNTSYFQDISVKTVNTGYYYRAKTTHFVRHNGTTEQATEYSNWILAN